MSTKKNAIYWLILFILAPMAADAADLSGSIDDIAAGIATYFPKAAGIVTTVEADTVSIDIKDGFGLSEGVLLSVYREGSPFYHPVTGIPLGRFEEEVAWVELVQFDQKQVIAKRAQTPPQKQIVQGDFVRLTKGRIPIGVSGMEHDRFLLQEFKMALEGTGRFSTTILPAGSTVDVAATLGNGYIIRLTKGSEQPSPIVIVATQNVKTGKIISEVEVALQGSDESDFIVESLQRRLFEKYQKEF